MTRLLDEVRMRLEIPTQNCVLGHVTTALEAIERGAPVDLVFQSIAGTEDPGTAGDPESPSVGRSRSCWIRPSSRAIVLSTRSLVAQSPQALLLGRVDQALPGAIDLAARIDTVTAPEGSPAIFNTLRDRTATGPPPSLLRETAPP